MPDFISFDRRLDWELTKSCNLRCVHCISRLFHHGVPRELTPKEAQKIVERCAEGRMTQIHFLGGEPTARADFPALLSSCDDLGITTSFSTNGTKLSSDVLETWASLRHRRPLWVSFEDIRREAQDAIRGEGSFEAACNGARQLLSCASEVGFVVAFTVNHPALLELHPEQILDFFGELGARHVVFQDLAVPDDAPPELARLALDGPLWLDFLERLFAPGLEAAVPWTYKVKPLVMEELNRRLGTDFPLIYYGCNGLSTEFRLLPNGTLLPCSAVVGWPELLKMYIDDMPTLLEVPLEELVKGEPFHDFLASKAVRDVDPFMEPCRSCHLAFRRCNPCVFGRITQDDHHIQACAWVRASRSNRPKQR